MRGYVKYPVHVESILYRFHNVRLPNCYRLPWTQTNRSQIIFSKAYTQFFLLNCPYHMNIVGRNLKACHQSGQRFKRTREQDEIFIKRLCRLLYQDKQEIIKQVDVYGFKKVPKICKRSYNGEINLNSFSSSSSSSKKTTTETSDKNEICSKSTPPPPLPSPQP